MLLGISDDARRRAPPARPPALTLATCVAAAALAAPPALADELEPAKRVSRSLWAVVPDAPPAGREPTRAEIADTAVAIDAGRLVAACDVLGDRREVLLWRNDERLTARSAGADATGRVCELGVPAGARLSQVEDLRAPADLRPGDPVVAEFNETSAVGLLAASRIADDGRSADGELRAKLDLPADVRGAVLVDADGCLVGLVAIDRRDRGIVVPVPPGPPAAPGFAARDIVEGGLAEHPASLAARTDDPSLMSSGERDPDSDKADGPGPGRADRSEAASDATRSHAKDDNTASEAGQHGDGSSGHDTASDADRAPGGDH